MTLTCRGIEHARALKVSVDLCHMDTFFLAATNGLGANLEHQNIALDCEQRGSFNAHSSKSPA